MSGSRRMARAAVCAAALVCVVWVADAQGAQAGEPVVGALVAKTDTAVDILPEDQKQARRIVLAPAMAAMDPKFRAFMTSLAIGSKVSVSVTIDAAGHRTNNVAILAPPGKWGKFIDTIMAVGPGRLEFKGSDGKKRVFAAPFTATGPDKEMTAAIAKRNAGDRVEIRWREDDWPRVLTIRVLDISAEAAAKPGFQGGTVVGKVAEKGKDFVVIQPDQGDPQRYVLQTIAGAKDEPDQDMLAAIAAVKVGDPVEAKWFKDGDRRLYFLKPAGGAKAAPAGGANGVAAPPPAGEKTTAAAPPSVAERLKSAPANTWVEVPDSALLKVAPKSGQFPKTWAVCGPSSVVMAWCGAALDTKRDRLVIWGGGHADYHGNELYVFNIKKMAWERLNDPFPNPVKDQEVNADGSPNSRHTYGGLAYLAHVDRFFGLGGSLAGVGFAKCDRTWVYDFDAKKWEDRQPTGQLPGGGFCMGCAYDPVSKRLFFGSEHRGLYAYDYEKNTWAHLDNEPVDGQGFAVDTKHKLLVGIGHGRITLYDIGRNNFKQQTIKAPGAEEIVNAGNAAGFDYDPVSDRMVGWASWTPGKVFGLDLDARKWELKQADGGPKVSSSARNGVFGRWRYVSSLNAFIAVSDAGANVFFYKYAAGTGAGAEAK